MIRSLKLFKVKTLLLLTIFLSSCVTTNRIDDKYKNAITAYINEDYSEAKIILDDILSTDSFNIDALLLRAYINQHLKNYHSSILDYKLILEIEPSKYIAYFHLGNIYLTIAEYEKAINNYSNVIEVNNFYEKAFLNRANTYMQMEKHFEARSDYKQYLLLDPSSYQKENIEKMISILDEELSN